METPGAIKNPKVPGWLNRIQERFWTGPPHPVARVLHEGDEVAGFTVLETPGHSAGHVSFWRESDRVLIVGDVLGNMNFITCIPGLNTAARPRHPEPRPQPRVGAAPRGAGAGARLLRPRRPAARPPQALRVRRAAAAVSALVPARGDG